MYQENDSGTYDEITTMPTEGYIINETESYCTIDGTNRDTNARLYTNELGEHIISNLQKNEKCYLYFDKEVKAADIILAGKSISNERSNGITNILIGDETRDSNTLYTAEDDDGTSYFFAGLPNNNWVSFAGHYWRIIRINGDRTIRLIYSGTGSPQTTGEGTQIGTSEFNLNEKASYYVGLKYTESADINIGQHGTTIESTILSVLNTWYTSNISSAYRSYIDTNAGFCGDREMASGYSWSATPNSTIKYIAQDRISTKTAHPSLKCINMNDLYTLNGASKGNKSLSNPVGLITADEVAYAGSLLAANNINYYLYTGEYYWTMSPYNCNVNNEALMFTVGQHGFLYWNYVHTSQIGVRPVINLRADIQLTGNGTTESPYTIVES